MHTAAFWDICWCGHQNFCIDCIGNSCFREHQNWFVPPEDIFLHVSWDVTQRFTMRWLLCFSINSASWTEKWVLAGFISSIHDMFCVSRQVYRLSFKELLELWGRGVQGRNRVSPHPSAPSATHSLKCLLHFGLGWIYPVRCLFFFAGGRSQAVVGKSRTTGSIYLTSVSSTIAKHHQRAAGSLQVHTDSWDVERFRFIRGVC